MLLEKRPMPTFEPFIQKQRFPRGCPGWPERYGTAETQLINQRWGVLSERGDTWDTLPSLQPRPL